MTGLSVAFAFKTGPVQHRRGGGSTPWGAYGALYCAIVLHPALVCGPDRFGGAGRHLGGAIPGLFKAYLNINEVITSIMFNWIGLYLVNEIIYGNGTGVMYDSRNTRTWNLRRMEGAEGGATIPDFGLNDMFQTNSTTIAIFLSIVVAILIWVVLDKTTFGYELKAVGPEQKTPPATPASTRRRTWSSRWSLPARWPALARGCTICPACPSGTP